MPTPSIQTLRADAQQVLNLDSISAVRSVVAATLANANAGTPLNPNLTTQQLWNEFYQIVTQPKSDIESIIANQLMKFLFAPPAPGGAGADKQVIFNDGGVLAGDTGLTFNKTTDLLTVGSLIVPGNVQLATVSTLYVGTLLNPKLKVDVGGTGVTTITEATITGDLTVDTSTLKVDSTNNRVGIGTASPTEALHINRSSGAGVFIRLQDNANTNYIGTDSGNFRVINNASQDLLNIEQLGVFTFGNGAGGTRMTLNSTGLGVGTSPANDKLLSLGSMGILLSGATSDFSFRNSGGTAIQRLRYTDATGALTIGSATGTAYPVELGGNTTTRAVTIDASSNVISNVTGTAPTLGTNNQMVFNLTSNTNLRISVRGTDGVTRTADLTLA